MTGGIENFSDDDYSLVHAHGRVRSYAPGEVIIEQGTRPEALYWVIEGRIHIGLSRIAHRDPIDDLGPGSLFGEVAYLLDVENPTFAVAVDQSDVLVVDFDAFRELKVAYPGMAARFFKSLSCKLAARLNMLTEA